MTVNVRYTEVSYTVYKPDADNPQIAHKHLGVLNIYDGRATKARIAKEVPYGATVERVRKIELSYDVAAKKALAWLAENGKINE